MSSSSRRWVAFGVAVLLATVSAFGFQGIGELPKKLPTGKIKQDGKMMAVKTTTKKLTESPTKPCRKCKGDGKVIRKRDPGERGGIRRADKVDCTDCRGSGRVPNDPGKVELAAIAVATSITRLAPDAPGADIALQEAFDAITETVVKHHGRFRALQKQSTFTLAQKTLPVDKIVMFKASFAQQLPHPTKKDEKIYVVRVPGKKLVAAIVEPKHAELPPDGGVTLVAGAIAGSVDVGGERVVLLEHGFLTSPTPDVGWWVSEW